MTSTPPVKVMIAYSLVIVLTSFCFFAGALLVIFLGTHVLAKASPRLREIVVGGLSGLVGVAASFAFSYFLFRLLCGTDAFGLFPLLAATVPLIFPIRNEFAKSQLLFNDIKERRRHPSPTVRKTLVDLDSQTYAMAMSARFRAVGAVLGVSLAFIWLFLSIKTQPHDVVIRVHDYAGNVIETHEHKGESKEP